VRGVDIQVCRAGFEERSKWVAREIAANQQDRRIDLEVCKAVVALNAHLQT
jgi:hypothetical protein